jgi:hypothetical protein
MRYAALLPRPPATTIAPPVATRELEIALITLGFWIEATRCLTVAAPLSGPNVPLSVASVRPLTVDERIY